MVVNVLVVCRPLTHSAKQSTYIKDDLTLAAHTRGGNMTVGDVSNYDRKE